MKYCKLIVLVLLMAVSYQGISAQNYKIGHINSNELLQAMPATKQAEKELESFTSQWQTKLEMKYKAIDDRMNTVITAKQTGDLTASQEQEAQVELQTMQQEALQLEQQAQQELAQKQEALLNPILDQARSAIEAYAQEQGYSYIFDTSLGVILHAMDSDDVTAGVRAKLGM